MAQAEEEPDSMAGGELGRRLIVAGLGIPLAVFLVYQGGWALGALLALVAGAGAWEFFVLARRSGGGPLAWLGVPAAALLVLLATLRPELSAAAPALWTLTLALTLASLLTVIWLRGPEGGPLSAAAATVVGVVYTGGGLSFAMLIRHFPPDSGPATAADPWAGPVLLIFVLGVTWMGDTCAYFLGKRWGRRKLVPRISPGKTVVGGVAGLAGSLATALAFALLLDAQLATYGLGMMGLAALGLALGAGAQIGDLAESVLKREAGVKDSGDLLPGHGGVLDRFDALFLNLPLAYGIIALLGTLG